MTGDASAVATRQPVGCAAVMMAIFRAVLEKHHLPVTHQREVVAQTLFESGSHLSADELAEQLRSRDEHVGKATVYRTLALLVEIGLATEHDFNEGFKRYEPRVGPSHHDHMICSSCGTVVEFRRAQLDELQNEVAAANGFQVISRQLKLYGLCKTCVNDSGDEFSRF